MTKTEVKKKHLKKTKKVEDVKSEKIKSEKVEKVEAESVDDLKDDEPSWYHYVIILAVIALVFFGIMFLIEMGKPEMKINGEKEGLFYKYEYNFSNRMYNVYFRTDEMTLIETQIPIELSLDEMLNSRNISMLFVNYNGTDNGKVGIGASFLTSFLTGVHNMNFARIESVNESEFNCNNSTIDSKIILFKPYSKREGIFYNLENGCIEFETYQANRTLLLTEKFVYYNIIENEN